MITALLNLGKILSGDSESLPIKTLDNVEGDLCYVVFDNDSKTVSIMRVNPYERMEEDLAYVGNAGGQKSQDRITTDQLKYILGFNKDGEIEKKNKFALQVVAQKLGDKPTGRLLSKVLAWYSPDPNKYGEAVKDYWDCILYTVKVREGGKEVDIPKQPDYRSSLMDQGGTVKGTCQLCGSERVLPDPAYPNGSLLKIFIVDKKGFLPGLSEDKVVLAHAVCPSCRKYLELGSNRVEDKMVGRIRRLNVYVIPDLPGEKLKEFLGLYEPSQKGVILEVLEDLERAEREVKSLAKEAGVEPRLTLVFGAKAQAKFQVWRVIPEVSVMRLIDVLKVFAIASGVLRRPQTVTFSDLYASLPVREGRSGVDPRNFLDFLQAFLEGNPLEPSFVYKLFMESVRCRRYETCENGSTWEYSLEDLVQVQEIFIYSMRLLGLMGTVPQSKEASEEFDVEKEAERLGLTGARKGLFLLGYLTALVGKEQAKKGDTRKAILDRLDFEGMDTEDVKVYSNRLMESLRDYNQLNSWSEMVFGEAQRSLAGDLRSLTDPQENVFLILLGYSLTTKWILSHGKRSEGSGTEE